MTAMDPLDPVSALGVLAGGLMAVFFLLSCFFLVLWLFVPFALFGLKKRLDRIAQALELIGARLSGLPRPGQDVNVTDREEDIFSAGRRS